MDKFKIGNRVKYVSKRFGDEVCNPKWGGYYGKIAGTIDSISWGYSVMWDNGNHNSSYEDSDLEFIEIEVEKDIKFSGGF